MVISCGQPLFTCTSPSCTTCLFWTKTKRLVGSGGGDILEEGEVGNRVNWRKKIFLKRKDGQRKCLSFLLS